MAAAEEEILSGRMGVPLQVGVSNVVYSGGAWVFQFFLPLLIVAIVSQDPFYWPLFSRIPPTPNRPHYLSIPLSQYFFFDPHPQEFTLVAICHLTNDNPDRARNIFFRPIFRDRYQGTGMAAECFIKVRICVLCYRNLCLQSNH